MSYLAPFPSGRGILIKLSLLTDGVSNSFGVNLWILAYTIFGLQKNYRNITLLCGAEQMSIDWTV